VQIEIDRLRIEASSEINKAAFTCDTIIDEASKLGIEDESTRVAEYEIKIEAADRDLGTLEAQRVEIERAEGTKATIAKLETEHKTAESWATEADETLTRIQSLKERLVKDIPIKGLEIVDGEIFIDGIPLATLNTAERDT
jgi:hypothetical protein